MTLILLNSDQEYKACMSRTNGDLRMLNLNIGEPNSKLDKFKLFLTKCNDDNITSTIRCQLAVLLNSIKDTHDIMSNGIKLIGIISLLRFKGAIKRYLNNKSSYFCSIINCYICKQYH